MKNKSTQGVSNRQNCHLTAPNKAGKTSGKTRGLPYLQRCRFAETRAESAFGKTEQAGVHQSAVLSYKSRNTAAALLTTPLKRAIIASRTLQINSPMGK
jgi:hypothetical protein